MPADVALPFAIEKLRELQSPDVAALLEIENEQIRRLADLLRRREFVLEPGTVDVLHSLYKKLRGLKDVQRLLETIDRHPEILGQLARIARVLANE